MSQAITSSSIQCLILSTLRWLDHVENEVSLVELLCQILQIELPDLQRELIAAVPEIVSDESHTKIAEVLTQVMSDNADLTVPVLDALSNLNSSGNVRS
jgi:hypothetical protein